MIRIEETLVIDGCAFAQCDFPGYTKRMASVSLDAVLLTVPYSHRGFLDAASSMGRLLAQVDTQSEKLSIARTAHDIEAAQKSSRTALVLAFQDPAPVENRLDFLRVFFELGLRVVQLTYNRTNTIGTGCTETTDGGLTEFGRELVREMNRLGVLIDLSHCSRRTVLDAIEESEHSVVFSHANVKAISDNPRNHTDEELRKLAQKGGVIGLTPWGPICWKRKKNEPPSLNDYLDHVEYVVSLVGVDHVGFGTDNTLDGATDEEGTKEQGRLYPSVVGEYDQRVGTDPSVRYARGFGGYEELGNVIDGLMLRGFTETHVKQFLGENFMRVFRSVWKGTNKAQEDR